MYRFLLSPRWLAFHLLVVLAIVLMVNLGFWQLRRLDQRQELNAAVSSRVDLPPQPLEDLLGPGTDPAAVEWRAVTARGTYLPDEQLTVVNRSQGGIAGYNVVTPMELADGRVLLVERGFVPLGQEPSPAPAGTVEVTGRLRPSQDRRTGQLTDVATGELTEAQRIDIDRLAPQLPGEPVPMFVDLTSSEPAEVGAYPQPVPLPELTEGSHLSYAVQWFLFAAAVAVGWVLAVRKSAGARRDGGRPAAAGASREAVGAARPTSPG